MPSTSIERPLSERAMEVLRRAGNPFRNYFARNPDDEVCARYHVPELFALEREQLLGVVDLYRYEPGTHSEIVPILGNKGAGKTHLLHSIKHGGEKAWQMLVTPGTYQKDSDFLEYLLFQIIDTLLGGGKQKGKRPLEYVGQDLVRRQLVAALSTLTAEQRLDLFPPPGLARWTRHLGLGSAQAQERTQWLVETLRAAPDSSMTAIVQRFKEVNLEPERACRLVCEQIERTESHNTAGLMRRHIYQGFARAILLGDESDLANFLTFGFAELEFHVRPSRQDLVLALLKVLMEMFRALTIPVVVAFDQLEDLLLGRRNDDGPRVAEAFFAGIVQAMHQVDGICFLIFAERGLWNRFVPSLDGYIQDRLNNPVHVPGHGTIKAVRLEAPPADLLQRIVEARLRPGLEELPDFTDLDSLYPFEMEQVERIAKTEPTLRDMLQQFRHLYDRLVYGTSDNGERPERSGSEPTNRITPVSNEISIKSVVVVESAPAASAPPPTPEVPAVSAPRLSLPPSRSAAPAFRSGISDQWEQAIEAARAKLAPEGAITGATRELQAGLGEFLRICHEHGVKIGPWRLQHVVGEWTYGDHPTYGVVSIAHWVCKDGQPWKVGIGLFLARGPGKPKDLEIKLGGMKVEPPVIDHLILLRPEDDLTLSGKSKTLWQEAERRGHHARLEAVGIDGFAMLYGFPRWLTAITESLPAGQPLPNLADFLQEKCEKLSEQVCMPVHGS
jgi:hypothetical protein